METITNNRSQNQYLKKSFSLFGFINNMLKHVFSKARFKKNKVINHCF